MVCIKEGNRDTLLLERRVKINQVLFLRFKANDIRLQILKPVNEQGSRRLRCINPAQIPGISQPFEMVSMDMSQEEDELVERVPRRCEIINSDVGAWDQTHI